MAEGSLESCLQQGYQSLALSRILLWIKGSIQQGDITFVNVYAHNIGAPKCTKQILTYLRRETDSSTVTVGDFNNTFRSTEITQAENQTYALNDKLDKMDLTEIKHSIQQQHKMHFFFQCAWNILQDRSCFGPQNSLNKFKKTEIISAIFFCHDAMKVEINYKIKIRKFTNMWQLNKLPNNSIGQQRNHKNLETSENGNKMYKTYGMKQKQF